VEKAFSKMADRVVDQNIKGEAANLLISMDFEIDPNYQTPELQKTRPNTIFDLLNEVKENHSFPERFVIRPIRQLFVDAGIEDDVIGELSDDILHSIGITNVGDRLRILKCLRARGLLRKQKNTK